MTREEFNRLFSNGQFACPDCGSYQTHPAPGCSCPVAQPSHFIEYTRHINANHHTCAPDGLAISAEAERQVQRERLGER